jgi:hypothetical protein
MKGCLRFFIFIFWVLPNLVKYTYGWSPLKQHHKIEKHWELYINCEFFLNVDIFQHPLSIVHASCYWSTKWTITRLVPTSSDHYGS